jgi:hypothetical protein
MGVSIAVAMMMPMRGAMKLLKIEDESVVKGEKPPTLAS